MNVYRPQTSLQMQSNDTADGHSDANKMNVGLFSRKKMVVSINKTVVVLPASSE